MILLMACTGTPSPTDTSAGSAPPVEDSAAPTARGALPLVPLTEAEDLDPAAGAVLVSLTAAPHTYTFLDVDGTEYTVEGYAYNGLTAGPLIRAQRGDVLTVEFTNGLEDDTTIHWHGLAVPFAMDGVTWLSEPIAPGATFTYTFTLDQAGTFWYHPHFNTDEQVSKGLYGVLIVEDPDDPVPDEEVVLVIDDWDMLDVGGDEDDHQLSEGTWTVNGQIAPTLTLTGGTTARVRMLNASNLGYLDLSWPDMRVLGTDQGIAAALELPEQVVLAPGDRVETEWLVGQEGFSLMDAPYSHQGGSAWGEDAALLEVEVEAPAEAPAELSWPFSGEAPSEDPGTTDIVYVFSGARETGVWLMNGEVYPDVTIEEVALGETAIIEVRNLSPAEHPYHLHGIEFEVLSVNGEVPAYRRLEDSLNVPIYGTLRLRIEADNPGDWMSHCHILPHAEGGMMTVLRVQ